MERVQFVEEMYVNEDERAIRTAVFMEEQGFQQEFDAVDDSPKTHHMVMTLDGRAVGCCRWYPAEKPGEWLLGRVAVVPDMRRKGIASTVVTEAVLRIREVGGVKVTVGAQSYVQSLYTQMNFAVSGEPYMDEGVEHVPMTRDLSNL